MVEKGSKIHIFPYLGPFSPILRAQSPKYDPKYMFEKSELPKIKSCCISIDPKFRADTNYRRKRARTPYFSGYAPKFDVSPHLFVCLFVCLFVYTVGAVDLDPPPVPP